MHFASGTLNVKIIYLEGTLTYYVEYNMTEVIYIPILVNVVLLLYL